MRYLKLTLLPLFLGLSISVIGQTTEVFTSTTSWLVPSGVTSIDVTAYGAGAGGETKGSGGGGGAYVSTTIAVTPGQTLDILVPAGGAPGTDGGDAEVLLGASTLVRADGGLANGNGGGSIANNVPVNVGANGGAGGNNDKDAGGGGGASGSSAGDGADGTKNKNGGAGGIGVAGGGSGGDGGDKNVNGAAGTPPGGGGGAGGKDAISGAGGRAEVAFNYTVTNVDTDGDGVLDNDDLDDDNDGILDVDETYTSTGNLPCPGGLSVTSVTAQPTFTGSIAALYDGNLTQQNFYFDDNQAYTPTKEQIFRINLSAPAALTQITVLTQEDGNNQSFLGSALNYKIQGLDGSTWVDIPGSFGVSDGVITDYLANEREEFNLSSNQTAYSSYRLFWIGGGQIQWDCWIEEITFTCGPSISSITETDTDGDGVENAFDLDSDNDGVFDAIEANASVTLSDLDSDGRWLGGVNANGIPLGANGGTGFSPLNTDGNGRPDFIDLDSDDDACSDANEYYSDTISDGGDDFEYGLGTPAVDANGLVLAAPYNGSGIINARNNAIDICSGPLLDADLGLTKTVSRDTALIGDTVTYTLTVQNYGPDTVNQAKVVDVLTTGLTYISHSGGSYSSVNGEWNIGTLNAGDVTVLNITAVINFDVSSSPVVNNAAVISEASDPPGGNANDAFAEVHIPTTDLRLIKDIIGNPLSAFEDDTLEYRIQLRNLALDTATGIFVYDTLPPGVTFVAFTNIPPDANVSYASGVVTYEKTFLEPAQNRAVRYTVSVNIGTAGSTITNFAEIGDADQFDTDPSNNSNDYSIDIDVPSADVGVLKSIVNPTTYTQGDTIVFSIQAYNLGPGRASNVLLSDYLPSNLDFVSYVATSGTYTFNDGLWSNVSIEANDTATLTLTTFIKTGGRFVNTARVLSSNVLDTNPANEVSSVDINSLKTYGAGSCIINMSQTPQTRDNTLAAYGLLWTLVVEDKVPVDWVIRPDKDFVSQFNKADQVDYTVNGVNYSSGFFVVDELFVPDALASINQFVAATDVEVNCNQPAFTTAVHRTLTSFPKAVLDQDNGNILEAIFYDHIGVTNQIVGQAPNGDDIYSLYRPNGLPGNLGLCDDIYAMPHADPHTQWSNSDIETFDVFIKNGGFLWAGCHAVSALETYMDIPSIPGGAPQMNYLSVDGLIPWDDGARINTDGTLQYYYNTQTGQGQYYDEIASEPIMQFLGEVDQALKTGSEEIYVPYAAGWRPSTTIAVYDPDHPDILGPTFPTNAAAVVAYGRAFGNPDYGFLVYEGSHSFNSGNESQNVAAARIYGNFLLQAGVEFKPEIVPTRLPQEIIGGVSETFSVEHNPELEYEWFAACGGTFSNPDSSWTTFIPPIQVDTPIRCIMRLAVTDQCGRTNFLAEPYFVYPYADIEVNKVSLEDTVTAGEVINYTITAKNNGPSPSVELVVRDIIPLNMTVETSTPSFGTWSTPDWTIGSIDSGTTVSLALTLKTDTTIATGCYTNTAFVKSLSIDTVQTNDTGRVLTCVNNPLLLPVELVHLDAKPFENRQIDITWTTATEVNNEGFELQRSEDGIIFEEIAWLGGNGTSTVLNEYFYSDYYVEKNVVYYYRLKQIDYDGQSELSKIVSAKIGDHSYSPRAELIPNPSRGNGVVKIKANIGELVDVQVVNMYGVVLQTRNFRTASNGTMVSMDLSNFDNGVYNVLIQIGKETLLVEKWVKID